MSLSQTLQSTGRMAVVQMKAANKHVLRALVSLASAALLVRAGGMVNLVVSSASFGAGAGMDAYFVAAAFPLLFVQLVSSAIEAAVLPVYTQLRVRSSKEAASRLFSTLLNGLLLGMIPLLLTFFLLRQQLVQFSAPGLDAVRLHQAIMLAPLLYLSIPFSLVIGLLECVLNAEGQFGWPAYAGLLVPLTTAALTLPGGRNWGIAVLCAGGLLGTLLQLAVVCLRARRARLRYRLVIDIRGAEPGVILRAAWPVLLGALVSQGSPIVDQIFASTLTAGSIAALNYAIKLVSVFSGILFVSAGRALLPSLARQAALNDPHYRAFKGTLRLYLWGIGLCTLIGSLGLFLLARPLVHILFQHGAFSATHAQNTITILLGFAPGLIPMAAVFLLSRAFNALGETRVPMCVAFVSVGINALFDALFAHYWQGLGIALATSVVYLLIALLLLTLLSRRIGPLQFWRLPPEFVNVAARFFQGCERAGEAALHWFEMHPFGGVFPGRIGFGGLLLIALTAGSLATARDAQAALHIALGLLLVLCFLRHPSLLLCALASVNTGIGSSLALFNGNNLDMMLIVPLLLLLAFLPWREICQRMSGLIWLLLYFGWILLGIGLSPLDARAFLTLWLTMLAAVATGVLSIALLTTRRRLFGVIDVLLVTALLAALYGLAGYVTHQNGEIDPGTQLFRVTSFFTQATTFALYLSLVLPLAFWRCLLLKGARKPAGIAVTLCLLTALLLTFTRTAYAGIWLEALVMILCLPGHRRRFLLVSGLIVGSGLVLWLGWSGQLPYLARFFNEDLTTLNGRVYLWQALLSRFEITQWRGNGLQSSDRLLAYLRVGVSGQGVIGMAPHNLFLGTLYDHGVIGVVLLCGIFFSQGARLLRGVRASRGERRLLYAAALATLANMFLQSLESRDLWIQAIGVPFWLVMALPSARYWPRLGTTAQAQRERMGQGLRPALEPLEVSGISSYLPQ